MMNQWIMRRAAVILALALTMSQMSACAAAPKTNLENTPVSNNAVVSQDQEVPSAGVEELTDAEGWLEENLGNIHQSLLEGDYAKVVEIMLDMQEDLANDVQYNALLYIAYMGSGNADQAADLLNNPNLNIGGFTDAFLELAEALKDNPDIAEIQRQLIEHMMALGESNPDAYAAVVKIGAVINNDDPTDPTAYAVRYIAAMAAGDLAAMEAILEEAKANGITAEVLSTTTAEYIERVNLTIVSVEDVQNGIMTSTTYSESGNVVKVEQTVTNPDGTKTEYAKDKNGVIYGIAQYGKDGKIESRTLYHYDVVVNPQTQRIEQKLVQVEVQSYEKGVISEIAFSDVNSDGSTELDYKLSFDSQGELTSGMSNKDGIEVSMSDEEIAVTKVEIVDGDVISTVIPVVDQDGNVVGTLESKYSYYHPAGVIEDRKQYVDGKLQFDAEYNYSYESGNVDKIDIVAKWFDQNGEPVLDAKLDYAENTYTEYNPDGSYEIAVLDITGKYLLTQEVFDHAGNLTERRYGYYTGNEMTSELDVHYDEQGRVIKEVYYGEDREIDLNDPKTIVEYQYSDGQTLVTKDEYDQEGRIVSTYQELYTYDVDGTIMMRETLTLQDGEYAGSSECYYLYDEASNSYVELQYNYDANGAQTATMKRDFYGSDGKLLGTIYKADDGETGFVQNRQDQYSYNEDGTVKQIDVYAVENGEGTKTHVTSFTYNEDGSQKVETKDLTTGTSSVTEYTYTENGDTLSETVYEVDAENNRVDIGVKDYSYGEDGAMSGYTITAVDADGNIKVTHYTAEGYPYEVAVYDIEGNLLMVMKLDPEETIPEETVPEETIPEETVPEETIPEETVHEETVPEETVPEETIPEETIPEETVPEETVPEETVPEETVPETIVE